MYILVSCLHLGLITLIAKSTLVHLVFVTWLPCEPLGAGIILAVPVAGELNTVGGRWAEAWIDSDTCVVTRYYSHLVWWAEDVCHTGDRVELTTLLRLHSWPAQELPKARTYMYMFPPMLRLAKLYWPARLAIWHAPRSTVLVCDSDVIWMLIGRIHNWLSWGGQPTRKGRYLGKCPVWCKMKWRFIVEYPWALVQDTMVLASWY